MGNTITAAPAPTVYWKGLAGEKPEAPEIVDADALNGRCIVVNADGKALVGFERVEQSDVVSALWLAAAGSVLVPCKVGNEYLVFTGPALASLLIALRSTRNTWRNDDRLALRAHDAGEHRYLATYTGKAECDLKTSDSVFRYFSAVASGFNGSFPVFAARIVVALGLYGSDATDEVKKEIVGIANQGDDPVRAPNIKATGLRAVYNGVVDALSSVRKRLTGSQEDAKDDDGDDNDNDDDDEEDGNDNDNDNNDDNDDGDEERENAAAEVAATPSRSARVSGEPSAAHMDEPELDDDDDGDFEWNPPSQSSVDLDDVTPRLEELPAYESTAQSTGLPSNDAERLVDSLLVPVDFKTNVVDKAAAINGVRELVIGRALAVTSQIFREMSFRCEVVGNSLQSNVPTVRLSTNFYAVAAAIVDRFGDTIAVSAAKTRVAAFNIDTFRRPQSSQRSALAPLSQIQPSRVHRDVPYIDLNAVKTTRLRPRPNNQAVQAQQEKKQSQAQTNKHSKEANRPTRTSSRAQQKRAEAEAAAAALARKSRREAAAARRKRNHSP